MSVKTIISAMLGCALTCQVSVLFAQGNVQPSPKFDIQRIEITGNTLLSGSDLEFIVAPYVGKRRELADVQRAQAALEQAYRDLGLGVVRVTLPEQNITSGVILFRVLQPTIGRVNVEGNKYFESANVLRSLPSLKEGVVPNSKRIARDLHLVGEHPIKRSTVLLRSSDKPDQVGDTGYLRSGIGFQHSNLFNRDHTLSVQYITSPTHPSKVSIYGLGYRIPYYGWNSSLDLYAGYSDVNSGIVQGLFNVSGSGTILGARLNYYLPKWGTADQKLSLGLDYRAYRNNISIGGVSLVPDITVHPISLTYSATQKGTSTEAGFYAALSTNIPGGNDGGRVDFLRSRAAATDSYKVLRVGANLTAAFAGNWQARGALNGQYTRDSLISGEQFGLGGPDTVRGYLVREVSNDKGYSGQLELYTPDIGSRIGAPSSLRLRALAFYDFGDVGRNNALPGEQTSKFISSAGLGLRLNYSKYASLRFDVAHVLRDAGTRQSGNNRISAGLVLVF
jgi:hemolysin activation/secretion protein